MIYCGVRLNSESCYIVAMSDAFAVIDQRTFNDYQHDQISVWLELMKNRPDEKIQWFFDEHDISDNKHSAILLKQSINDADTFVIKHRKLANIIQLFYEWMAQETILFPAPGKAWFLASAVRLFDEKERIPCVIDDFPF
jgi:hypothetical protein